jgi:tetratricopeptide (TPR) repeat protein
MSNKKPVIFISYSHKDRSWLDYVRSFFEPLAKHWTLLTWDDEKLRIGDDWKGDIYSALDSCSIFVLLVSRYALASDFILNEEVGRILKRPKGEVQFCPVVVTPYFAKGLDWLDQPNRRPPDNKALSELLDPARDREMAVIAGQIDKILQTIPKPIPAAPSPKTPVAPDKPRTAFPSIVDYGRLPETPYKSLVGRDDELRRLDDAWADEKTRIISLVAWGGAGKTSLVIEWLMRFRNDGYRNANAVLCWSFYSQGTTERAASGDGFLDWAFGKLKIKLDTTSSAIKGERLAEEMSRRRVLLVLDGLEPMQYGPEGQQGALKDQGLRAFLRGLAVKQPAAGHSLVVLTSRLAVYDLRKWEGSTAPLIDIGRLSDEAGAALLADGGVKGSSEALREAAHNFAGHALALSLLAGFLRRLHGGNVSQHGGIRAVTSDPTDPGHDQARRVIEAYDKQWLATEPVLLAIMYLVGLFDRPASSDCIMALRDKPAIDSLTNALVNLDDDGWRDAIERLREVRLLDPEDPSAPDALDAHPLVREWFGTRLEQTNKQAWREAHGRLYEYLRDATKEGDRPTLEDLSPLYQAISHGCRAGRHQEALDQLYIGRICRRKSSGRVQFYSRHQLGAFGSDLVAISWFFDERFEVPIATLTPSAQTWILSEAARCLLAQGRFTEALRAQRANLSNYETSQSWEHAAISASNLSETELLNGEISAAVACARICVEYGDRAGGVRHIVLRRTILATALLSYGKRDEAERLFEETKRLSQKQEPDPQDLYLLEDPTYCELLFAKHDWAAARDRATILSKYAQENGWLLIMGTSALTLARAHLGLAIQNVGSQREAPAARNDARTAQFWMNEAVNRLRIAGQSYFIPSGLLARAGFRRNTGDWEGAASDLDEVEEIAQQGPMKLFLCDMSLERARLALAKIEAFAPLNGMVDNASPKPAVLDAVELSELKKQGAEHLAISAGYIETCGYHRRDDELAELQAVLRGERKFADLPPRV